MSNTTTVQGIENSIENTLRNTGGIDNLMAMETTITIQKVFSVILGILAILILITIPLTVLFELCYMNFPIIREKIDQAVDEHGGFIKRSLQMTLKDAMKAIEIAETNPDGPSVMTVYLKIKIKAVFIAMFCLMLVLYGTDTIVATVSGWMKGLYDVAVNFFSSIGGF